jgi:hypothetical protein
MKKNEVLLFSSKRMELENIILSEVSQAWKMLDLGQMQQYGWTWVTR